MALKKSQNLPLQWTAKPFELRLELTQRFLKTKRSDYLIIEATEHVISLPICFMTISASLYSDKVELKYRGSNNELCSCHFFTKTPIQESKACTILNIAIAKNCTITVRREKNDAIFSIKATSQKMETEFYKNLLNLGIIPC